MQQLLGVILDSDAACITRVIDFLDDQGYHVLTDKKNYVFGVPSGDYVSPVMLVAHIDTRRKSDAVSPAVFHDVLYNQNHVVTGAFGIDDRAGVHIVMEITRKLKEKPYILFTTGEETGQIGANLFCAAEHPSAPHWDEKFWKGKKIWEPYANDIYGIIEYDRRGFNSVVAYGNCITKNPLSDIAEMFGYNSEYGSVSDCAVLTRVTGIGHINLSAGYFHEHTQSEFLLIPAVKFAIDNGPRIIREITEPYRVPIYSPVTYSSWPPKSFVGPSVPGTHKVPPKEDWITFYSCDICTKQRPVRYFQGADAFVCQKCLNRVGEENITYHSITFLAGDLERIRAKSKQANMKVVPTCPVDSSHKNIFPQRDGVAYCEDCCTFFLHEKMKTYTWTGTPGVKRVQVIDHNEGGSETHVDFGHESIPFDQCHLCGQVALKETFEYLKEGKKDSYFPVCNQCKV